ncbi:hypothetical protein V5F53_20370 [Xanthobacter sp. V4C-4]|uniref:hypothetical protein n=1 Tax=Xanthobacter cornucopiae TaxID=3119924 RepID=UPI0037263A17
MAGFQVSWRGLRFDLDWGQVASETENELRILQPDGGAWIIKDVPGHGLRVVYHAAPFDPLMGLAPEPWRPSRRPAPDDTPDPSQA